MSYASISGRATCRQKYFAFFLCIAFILGFLAGAFLATEDAFYYTVLIQNAVVKEPTVIGVFAPIAVLFSLTVLVYSTGKWPLLILVCFLQAVAFGATAAAVFYSYGSAHWLIHAFLLFTKTVTLVSLLWFWLSNIPGRSYGTRKNFFLALGISALAGAMDFLLVSPFLIQLFA